MVSEPEKTLPLSLSNRDNFSLIALKKFTFHLLLWKIQTTVWKNLTDWSREPRKLRRMCSLTVSPSSETSFSHINTSTRLPETSRLWVCLVCYLNIWYERDWWGISCYNSQLHKKAPSSFVEGWIVSVIRNRINRVWQNLIIVAFRIMYLLAKCSGLETERVNRER